MIIKTADPIDEIVEAMRIAADATESPRQRAAILKRIDATIIGAQGEREVAHHLAHAYGSDPEHLVIHDLGIEVENLGAQIDHLVIRSDGMIACLETKTWSAAIRQETDGSWTARYGSDVRPVPSPTEQARRHSQMVARLIPKASCIPIVVVPSDCRLERRTADGVDVVRADLVASHINRIPKDARFDHRTAARALMERHRPRLKAIQAYLDSIGWIMSRPIPERCDLDRAAAIHAQIMKDGHRDTIRSNAIQMLMSGDVDGIMAFGASPPRRGAPQAVARMRTRYGESLITVLDDASFVFAISSDPRMKAHIRICAGKACRWDARRHGWIVVPQETMTTLACLARDNRTFFNE
jgi:hypothetical protein